MHQFPRPLSTTIVVERVSVDGVCPECGSTQVARYPVVGEIGWLTVTKCQDCLYSIRREPMNRMGSITLLSDEL